jgi:excinuclease ABC subunit A
MKNRPNGNAPVAVSRGRKTRKTMELDTIEVKGAREHNLKQIDIRLPKKKLIVFTGVSGSGKSSLAFDTIFAEGQRRYVESLSAYARQFIGQMEKPTLRHHPRDSVTDHFHRTKVGQQEPPLHGRHHHRNLRLPPCPVCPHRAANLYQMRHHPVGKGDAQNMVTSILEMPTGTKILILAPSHRQPQRRA